MSDEPSKVDEFGEIVRAACEILCPGCTYPACSCRWLPDGVLAGMQAERQACAAIAREEADTHKVAGVSTDWRREELITLTEGIADRIEARGK